MSNNPKTGSKNDSNYLEKPPLDLVTLEFLEETAKALGFGAAKYSRNNFKGGIDHTRLIAAILRHINQYNAGQDLDSESGLSHLAHAAASLNMLIWMVKNRPELDDRYKEDPVYFIPAGINITEPGSIVYNTSTCNSCPTCGKVASFLITQNNRTACTNCV